MKLMQRLRHWLSKPPERSRRRPGLTVERLEDRTVPASFAAGNVSQLIEAINAANQTPEADAITLAPRTTFTLKQMENNTYEPTGLPTIRAGGGSLTIIGNGDTIQRSTNPKTIEFRLFAVESGASLNLENLTLRNGAAGRGGAILNLGSLTLDGVTIQQNASLARGGGIYSEGSLIMRDCLVRENLAWGFAEGGGIYSAGSLVMDNCLVQDNQAVGRDGSNGGWVKDPRNDERYYSPPTPGSSAWGAGIYVAGGTASLTNTTVTNNTAKGGQGGKGRTGKAEDGFGQGGGLYISATAEVTLDAYTVDHIFGNLADYDPDIFGSYSTV